MIVSLTSNMDQVIRALDFALRAVRERDDETRPPSDIFGDWLAFLGRILAFVGGLDEPEDEESSDPFFDFGF